MKKGVLAVVAVGLIAAGITAAVLFSGNREEPPPAMTGKLSKKALEVENKFVELQQKWKAHEKDFREKKEFKALAELNDGFHDLALDAKDLKGDSAQEAEALPHLVASVEASAKVPAPYMMLQVNPQLVSEQSWTEKNAEMVRANTEWAAWKQKTATLAR